MDFMPLVPFLGVSIPESLVLYYMVLVLVRKKESKLFIAALSLLTSLFSYTIRSMPTFFGVHSILQVILMIILLNLFLKLPWRSAAVSIVLASVVLGLAEGIFVPFLAWAFYISLGKIISDPLLRILFTLPHLLFLVVLTYSISKHQRRLPLLERLAGVHGTIQQDKRKLLRQASLFTLCLIQALMLVLLKSSFYAYTSGVYPSFSLNTLVEISIFVLMIAALATILVASYLLQVIEREAKLETELRYATERHNLNLRLQVERHDFYNHLTAIYGYIRSDHYDEASTYIENLYGTVRQIEKLLKISPPELSAILSAKLEEAKVKGIELNWRVNIESLLLPLSPEDLTHLVGNLLDNALGAAKSSHTPRVDLTLMSNKLGLELKVSNNGSAIPKDIEHNIFDAGYTTKDTKRHSGLGLYIIKQIIEQHNGFLELNEPEDYLGVEFRIYIPWSN